MACGLGRSTLIGHVERSSVIPVELIMMVRVRRPWNAKTLLGDPCKTKNHMYISICYALVGIEWHILFATLSALPLFS